MLLGRSCLGLPLPGLGGRGLGGGGGDCGRLADGPLAGGAASVVAWRGDGLVSQSGSELG